MGTRLIILLTLFLSGCAMGTGSLRNIDPVMSPREVERKLGKRDGFSSAFIDGHTYQLHKYTNVLCSGWAWDKCDLYVVYRDNEVIETGVSSVRSVPSNMQFLYLFNLN